MSRLYLRLIIPIAVVCLIFMLAARAIGTTQPPNPALRGFTEGCEDKPQPCWYGIAPGVTTMEIAITIIEEQGYLKYIATEFEPYSGYRHIDTPNMPLCADLFDHDGDTFVDAVTLGCFDIKMGDIIMQWGIPNFLTYDAYNSNNYLKYTGYNFFNYRVEFEPFVNMGGIVLFIPSESPDKNQYKFYQWHGFAPLWRYCQLETNIAECK